MNAALKALRDLELRLVRRLAPFVTVERSAFFSNAILGTVVAIALARWLASPDALAHGDVGGDFRGFYQAGVLVRTGQADHLYDSLAAIMAGGPVEPPFMYPPAFAAVFAPLAFLPYGRALLAFWIISISCWLLACRFAAQELGGTTPAREMWLALRFAPLVFALALGQMTALLSLPLTGFVLWSRRSRDVLAGLSLGLLAAKPQLLGGLVLYLLLQRRFRLALASVVSALLVSAASFVFFPRAAWAYVHVSSGMLELTRTPLIRPWLQIGLFRVGTNLFDPWSHAAGTVAGTALTALGLVWLVVVGLRRAPAGSAASDLSLAVAIALGLLLSPHVFNYDAALLFVAFFLLQHRLRREPLEPREPYFVDERLGVAVFALCACFAVGPGLAEELNRRLGSPVGLIPATLALVYATYAVTQTSAARS